MNDFQRLCNLQDQIDLEKPYYRHTKGMPRWQSLNHFKLTKYFNQHGEFHMSATSFFVELRVNFNDDTRVEKEEMLKELMAKFCNVLLANAMMLQDRTDPYVSMVMNKDNETMRVNVSEHQVKGECPTCGHAIEQQEDDDESSENGLDGMGNRLDGTGPDDAEEQV